MSPSLNANKRAAAYLGNEIRQLDISYRFLDKLGLNRESVEASNAMVDLMQVHQMILERIAALESKPKRPALDCKVKKRSRK